jgi:hypothetical protein
MAIKVGGTEVVDNNRQLKNIASVDATTVAALGTAGVGGGGGSFDFTVSETVAAGDVAILKSNGQVGKRGYAEGGLLWALENSADSGIGSSSDQWVVYDPDNNVYLLFYRDNNVNRGKARVISYNSNTYTFTVSGAYEFDSSSGIERIHAVYDTTNNQAIVMYTITTASRVKAFAPQNNSTEFTSWGTFYTLPCDGTSNYNRLAIDQTNSKAYFCFRDGGDSNRGKICLGTLGNGTITLPITYGSSAPVFSYAAPNYGSTDYFDVVVDTQHSIPIVFWNYDSGSKELYASSFSVSGTNLTYTTALQIQNQQVYYVYAAYDPDLDKSFVYYWYNSDQHLKIDAITTASNGTMSKAGAKSLQSVFADSNNGGHMKQHLAYDPVQKCLVLAYVEDSYSLYLRNIKYNSGTNNYTVGSKSLAWDGSSAAYNLNYVSFAQNPTNGEIVTNLRGASASPKQSVLSPSDANQWIGISTENISSASTGTITLIGGVNESQTNLTVGKDYYLNSNGSLGLIDTGLRVGKSIASTKIVVTGNA